MTRPSLASAALIGAWLAVIGGASGRIFDLLPGGCADGIGCIFSVGLFTSLGALPVVLILGVLTLMLSSSYQRAERAERSRRGYAVGSIGAMVTAVLIAVAAWYFPYWPRY